MSETMRRILGTIALILSLTLSNDSARATALQSDITAAGWGALAGTTATAGNSGLADLSSSAFTFRAFSTSVIAPPAAYSSATGYLEGTSGSSVYVQPYRTLTTGDPLVGTSLSSPLNELWLDCWVYGQWDGSAISSQTLGSGPIIAPSAFWRLLTYCNGAASSTPYGFAIISQHSAAASSRYQWQLGANTSVVHAGWNRWHRLTVRFTQGASGKCGVYLNGVLVHESTGDTTPTASGTALKFTMPAVAGVKWLFTGPFKCHSGTSLTLNPCWELDNQPQSQVTRIYQPWNVQSSATNGSYFTSSGTGTVATDTEYAVAASSPYRHRLVFSGNGNSPVATTFDEIGALPFNEQGWATIVFSDVYCPSGTALHLRLYKTGGTSELIRLFVTGGQINSYSEGGPAVQGSLWTVTSRYAVCIHLNRDGRASCTLFDGTAIFDGSGKQAFSFPLQDWTPQAIGGISLNAAPTASNVETGYVAICRRPTFACVDSLSDTAYTPGSGGTVNIHVATCVGKSFPYGEETTNIPGAYWPRQIEHETSSGASRQWMPRRLVVAPIGRAGKTRRDWTHSIFSGMTHTHGIELLTIDGGSINDIANIGTGDSSGVLFEMIRNLESLFGWAVANDNAVWISTMLPRTRSITASACSGTTTLTVTATANGISSGTRLFLSGFGGSADGLYTSGVTVNTNNFVITGAAGTGTYTNSGNGGIVTGFSTQELSAIDDFNSSLRDTIKQYQSKGLLRLSDIAADYAINGSTYPNSGSGTASPVSGFWQDFTHPNNDPYTTQDGLRGGSTYAKRMVQLLTTPTTAPPVRRLPGSLIGRN